MAAIAQDIQQGLAHNIEIVLHINELLEESRQGELVSALEKSEGIKSAEFCPLRHHLLLVRYYDNMMSSQDVLGEVSSQKFHAKLIGPV